MDKFVAEKCVFMGEFGFMVRQIHNGKVVVEQWLSEEGLPVWMEAAGVEEIEFV